MYEELSLHIVDYVLFGLGILVSLATGIYYAYKERNEHSTFRFHRGGGKMKVLPVALSMLVTFESSIFYLGYPAEVYIHGFIFWLVNLGLMISFSSMFWISIPLFYPLQITSVYEYLQMRHGSLAVRQLAMALGTFFMVVYAGIVIFGAAVALESVTNVPTLVYIVAMTAVAVVYTSLGGLKAVIATDVVQGIVMIGIIFAVLIYGTLKVGGVTQVLEYNQNSGRLNLVDFDVNPYTRHTFWTLVVGSGIRGVGISCRQPAVQRLNSTKSISDARKVAALSIPGFVILQLLVMAEGLVAYAYFASKRCDPLASGQISNPNQIMAYAVMDMFSHAPGVTGLFLAALCSASLSTISSLLSSVSAIVSEDLLRQKLLKNASDATHTNASKIVVLICGVVCAGVSILISQVKGPVTQIAGSMLGAIDGPMTAIFIMTIFFKCTTRKGIFVSTFCGVIFAMWLSLGYNFSPGRKRTPWLPLGPTDQCYSNVFNTSTNYSSTHFVGSTSPVVNFESTYTTGFETVNSRPEPEIKGLDNLYSISYTYFGAMVIFVSLAIGLTVSKFTKVENKSPVPSYLMLSFNNRFFTCQPNILDTNEDMEIQNVKEPLSKKQSS
ncbi:hypothetical protein ACF0H5_024564 [Mactra antiquata]